MTVGNLDESLYSTSEQNFLDWVVLRQIDAIKHHWTIQGEWRGGGIQSSAAKRNEDLNSSAERVEITQPQSDHMMIRVIRLDKQNVTRN